MATIVSYGLVFAAVFSIAILLLTAGLAVRRYREDVAPWLAATTLIGACWALVTGVGLFLSEGEVAQWLEAIEWVFAAMIPVTWLGFAIVYTGRRHVIGRPIFAVAVIIPAATVGMLLSEQFIELGLIRTDVRYAIVNGLSFSIAEIGPWGYVQIAYSYVLIVLAVLLFTVQGLNTRTIHRRQATLLVTASLVPVILGVIRLGGFTPFEGADLTPFALGISGLIFLVAITKLDVLQTNPVPTHLAHEAILRSLETPLVVVNDANNIVHTNPQAEEVLSDDGPLMGQSAEVLPGIEDASNGSLTISDMAEMTGPDGRKIFVVRHTNLEDDYGRRHGSILLYQDLTGVQTREQRLNVLNRVLRHDIRNEMTVVLGYANDGLEESIDSAKALEAISETAQAVVDTSETAREIERLINLAPRLEPDGSIQDALEGIHTRIVREYPGASLETDIEVTPTTVVPAGFQEVLWHLAENGIQHNDHYSATVSICVEEGEGDLLECTVSDDGPGIPESELTVFKTGEVTALDHASGLGLWLVHWVVAEFGGSVHVESTEDGTSVTVTIPKVTTERTGD